MTMRKLELAAAAVMLLLPLSACRTDAEDTLGVAFSAVQAGDLPRFAETLTDEALTRYGNRPALEKLRPQFAGLTDPQLQSLDPVSEETSGDPFGPNGARVDQMYDAEFAASTEGMTRTWEMTVKCAYLDKWRGYGRGVERMLISCKISRFEKVGRAQCS